MNLVNFLKKFGYKPHLSDGILDKYEEALFKYLGEDRYEEFWHIRHCGESNIEDIIMDWIGDDLHLMRLILSGQISNSVCIVERIVEILKECELRPNRILDLGAADGWASQFIRAKFGYECTIDLVDRSPLWCDQDNGDNVVTHQSGYKKYNSKDKFDLIVSIFGANVFYLEDILDCVGRSIADDGIAMLGLRIPQEKDFIMAMDIANRNELALNFTFTSKVQTEYESFQIFFLEKKGKQHFDRNAYLSAIRRGYHEYAEVKRVFGYEAQILSELIADGIIHKSFSTEFPNGTMSVDYIDKNDILYRKIYNTFGDLQIEFPILKDEHPLQGSDTIGNFIEWGNSL